MSDSEALQVSPSASADPLRGKNTMQIALKKKFESKVACVFYIDNNPVIYLFFIVTTTL